MLATAESCTGGWIAEAVTAVPGSSAWFREGVVTYSDEAKVRRLGVDQSILDAHGAVSGEAAQAMAEGLRSAADVNLALSVTGIAGPSGGSARKPVGTVFMALAIADGVKLWQNVFPGDRRRVRLFATEAALDRLRRRLLTWPI